MTQQLFAVTGSELRYVVHLNLLV